MGLYLQNMKKIIKKNFTHATLNFVFIILFVNVFQAIFGLENSIVGVIFTIMMSASMVRDMTAAPLKHLFIQALVLVWMGISSSLVATINPLAALPINLVTIFLILYAFTYEYSTHMYFPYILSYLFLVFISPVPPAALPRRLFGLLAGAGSIILYQLFMGRKKVVETAHDVLTAIMDEAEDYITFIQTGEGKEADFNEIRHTLCRLSRTVYERRKRVLCVSDAGFSMIDAGRGLEHIILLLRDLKEKGAENYEGLLEQTSWQLKQYRAFVRREAGEMKAPDRSSFTGDGEDATEEDFYNALAYVYEHLLHMSDPEERTHYRKTLLSVWTRIKVALDVSPVRLIYAIRVALLLAVFTLAVQELALPHGKWLMFTLASLSLPYAEDVGKKTQKRIVATILGGLFSMALYALIPSMTGRTVIMMLSGYLSFYFSDYTGTYACSTVGALGGAVLMNTFGWEGVGQMFFIRISYICIGAGIALAANCIVFPFKRSRATRQLLRKYVATSELLTRICAKENVDTQLYYSLVIQAHLQEDKLSRNAEEAGWEGMQELLAKCRERVRRAHRHKTVSAMLLMEH